MRHTLLFLFLALIGFSCTVNPNDEQHTEALPYDPGIDPYIVVLGIAQDAGFPHAYCRRDCCKKAWVNPGIRKLVSCIALVDPSTGKSWMFDATPSFKYQSKYLSQDLNTELDGIFLTHAHIGHYTGLMDLGREAVGSKDVPVYAMPKMKSYLENNGPWSQLVSLNNIKLMPLNQDSTIILGNNLQVTPFRVPHRDEYSETVGFEIKSATKSALFIPDINKWNIWERSIVEEIQKVDYAFLDGSFYANGELPNRDMSEIPHPFVEESMALFDTLSRADKNKVHFIHFNHTIRQLVTA